MLTAEWCWEQARVIDWNADGIDLDEVTPEYLETQRLTASALRIAARVVEGDAHEKLTRIVSKALFGPGMRPTAAESRTAREVLAYLKGGADADR